MDNSLAPIVLFVYNRPEHTLRTLEALAANELADRSTLYIYADGPKPGVDEDQLQKIAEVRRIVRLQQWCENVIVVESETNKGLADSVINGVTAVVNRYGKVIVLEDDLITASGFLKYMNTALHKYQDIPEVMQVSGFSFPAINIPSNSSYFAPFISSWGWGTWKTSWEEFDCNSEGYQKIFEDKNLKYKFDLQGSFLFSNMLYLQLIDKKIDSWAIRWYYSVFSKEGLCLFPENSLVANAGFGDLATHTQEKNPYEDRFFDLNNYVNEFPQEIKVTQFNLLKEYFKSVHFPINNSSKHKSDIIFRVKRKFKNAIQKLVQL